MAQAVLELIAKTEGWTGGIKRAQTGLTNFIKTHGGLHQALAQDNQTMAQAIKKFGDFESKAATASGRIRETENAFIELGVAYKQMTAAERATPAGKATLESINKMIPKLREMKAQVKDLQGQLNEVAGAGGRGFGQQFMQSLVPGFGMGAGAVAAMAVVKALGKLKDVTVDAIKTNMDFEQSNANLSAILGKTKGEIYELSANAKALGGSTIYTASQITELQTVLSRRGFDESQILQMTHGISNLATATGTDLAQAAELAASTMQAFGMKATQMERIVSVLGVSTTKSALTTEKLGVSLQYVAPTARAAGFSLEETVAMLGALVDSGLDASTAGTSLRQIILGMSTANGKLAKSFGHPIRGLKDFTESIKKLKEDGNASLDSISKNVRVTAVPAFLSLVENADRLDELRDSITGVEDELQAMSDKMIDTARGSATMLKSAWEGLMLSFENSNGVLKDTLDWLTKIINKAKEWSMTGNGGQDAVNAIIGDEEDFRKRTAAAAEAWIEKWKQDNTFTIGGNSLSAASPYDLTGQGIVRDEFIPSEYNSYLEEANAKLKEQKALYDKLIPLSKKYAQHQQEQIVMPGAPGGRSYYYTDKTNVSLRKQIKDLLGVDLTYDQLNKRLADMYAEWKKYEAVVNGVVGDDFGGVLGEEEEEDTGNSHNRFLSQIAKNTKQQTPSEKYSERIEKALDHYQDSLEKAALEYDNGKYGEKESNEAKKRLLEMRESAEKTLFSAYYDVVAEMRREVTNAELEADEKEKLLALLKEYEPNVKNEVIAAGDLAKQIADLAKIIQAEKDAEQERLRKLREQRSIYNRALNGIESIARGNNIRYDTLGVAGFKEIISKDLMRDDLMQGAVDKLNEQLKTKGIRWTVKLDLDTGTLEKLKSRLDEVFEGIGKGTGGVKSIVGALDSVKKAGESMMDTLEGDADGWDKMIAVMNMGMAPLEAMVTIYEAINALKEMSMILSEKETAETIAKTAAEAADEATAATQTGTAAAQAVANTAVAETSIAAAQALMAEANAAKAAEYAAIPGGIAALPAALAALNAAYAGGVGAGVAATKIVHFAKGGVVPGAYNGGRDTVPALLSPQEIILNRAQQKTLAAQLVAPKWGMDGGSVQFIQRGTDLIGVINATVASKGGMKTHKIYQH